MNDNNDAADNNNDTYKISSSIKGKRTVDQVDTILTPKRNKRMKISKEQELCSASYEKDTNFTSFTNVMVKTEKKRIVKEPVLPMSDADIFQANQVWVNQFRASFPTVVGNPSPTITHYGRTAEGHSIVYTTPWDIVAKYINVERFCVEDTVKPQFICEETIEYMCNPKAKNVNYIKKLREVNLLGSDEIVTIEFMNSLLNGDTYKNANANDKDKIKNGILIVMDAIAKLFKIYISLKLGMSKYEFKGEDQPVFPRRQLNIIFGTPNQWLS
jgi:hypothetical protein